MKREQPKRDTVDEMLTAAKIRVLEAESALERARKADVNAEVDAMLARLRVERLEYILEIHQ